MKLWVFPSLILADPIKTITKVKKKALRIRPNTCYTVEMITKSLSWIRHRLVWLSLLAVPSTHAKYDGLLPNSGDAYTAIEDGTVSIEHIPEVVAHMIGFLLKISAGICVAIILVGGCQYIWGSFNDNKEAGKKTLLYAVVGLIIALLSWLIVELVQQYMIAEKVGE